MEFSELNLHPDLQKGISEAGYSACMPVQEQVLANAFGGQDLYVQSQTGTGKTAAYLIVIFQRLLSESILTGKKAIIMVPTRELAVQVEDEAKKLGKYLPFKVGSFYGGVGYTLQTRLLKENAQILVGTPGRVLDLNQSGKMNLMDIAFLVLDEADRMFDMGFYPDLRKLINVVPPADRRQTMLFSATLNAWVKNLAWEYTKNPREIEIAPDVVTVEEAEQLLYHVSSRDKMRLLLGILRHENPESALVFCNTKRYTEIVAKRLRMNGYHAEFIIGDLPQPKRLKVIEDIKAGKLKFLVATDVAARGLDIEGLPLVINYDLPNEAENYVHRIGRTARAGKTGKAITLASEQDVYELPAIERYIGQKIPSETVTEELLADDSSEGTRIHTEFTAESFAGGRSGGRRRDERDNRGRGNLGSRGSRRGAPRPDAEGGERREDTRQAGFDDSGKRQRDKKPGRGNRKPYGKSRPAEGLSKLSFDERMEYYREKYNAEIQEISGRPDLQPVKPLGEARAEGGRADRPQGKKRRDRNRRPDSSGMARADNKGPDSKRREAKRPPNERAGGNRQGSQKPETQNPAAAQTENGKPRGNIFSRLLGIFKKKKTD